MDRIQNSNQTALKLKWSLREATADSRRGKTKQFCEYFDACVLLEPNYDFDFVTKPFFLYCYIIIIHTRVLISTRVLEKAWGTNSFKSVFSISSEIENRTFRCYWLFLEPLRFVSLLELIFKDKSGRTKKFCFFLCSFGSTIAGWTIAETEIGEKRIVAAFYDQVDLKRLPRNERSHRNMK